MFEKYRDLDRWQLVRESHGLPEWEDPKGSSKEIPVEEILLVLGKAEEEIEAVRQVALEEAHFASIFRAVS